MESQTAPPDKYQHLHLSLLTSSFIQFQHNIDFLSFHESEWLNRIHHDPPFLPNLWETEASANVSQTYNHTIVQFNILYEYSSIIWLIETIC